MKLTMLKPRLATLDPVKASGLRMVEDLPRKPLQLADIRTTRWTKANNGRLLPLSSAAWRKLRASVLADKPLCEYCPPGVITPANTVDHRNNNPADNTRANLVSCCVHCHSLKTASDMHGRPARLGCDEQGNPANPSHHWNQAAVGASVASGEGATASQEITSD